MYSFEYPEIFFSNFSGKVGPEMEQSGKCGQKMCVTQNIFYKNC